MPVVYFLITIRDGKEKQVIEKIKIILEEMDIEHEVDAINGTYDVVIKISAESDDVLRDIVLKKIKPIEHIQSGLTMITIS